jgi:hypothetical protein
LFNYVLLFGNNITFRIITIIILRLGLLRKIFSEYNIKLFKKMKIKDSTFFGLLMAGLFLIIVIHISLKNLLKESVFRKNITNPPPIETRSNTVKTPLSDSKQELMDYIKSNIKQINESADTTIKGSNFFSPFHQSDIHDQTTDLSKYFQINQPVPEITALTKQLQGNNGLCKEPIKPQTDNLSGNPVYYDQSSNGSLAYKPDVWTYENERPMNGGVFDGIRGQDELQSDFATYPPATQLTQNNFQTSYPYTQSYGSW